MSNQWEVNKFFNKCMYKNCLNGRLSHGKRIYRFPLQTDVRHNLWICNSGNTDLQKWSASTLRRAGLCEDHFTPDSFNPTSVNKGLKRDAVPVPFDLSITQKNYKESNRKRKNVNEQKLNIKKNIMEQSQSEKNVEFTSISDIITHKSFQEPPLKTYKPATYLYFSSSEKDNMNWMNIQPSMSKRISMTILQNNANKQNEQNKENDLIKKINDAEKKINSLKSENIRLRNIIRCLQSFTYSSKMYNSKRTETKKKDF